MSNLTIINAVLRLLGPQPESRLCLIILGIQVLCTCCAFIVRYYVASIVYAA
jgi:hypothetical protein